VSERSGGGRPELAWPVFFARVFLGLLFLMGGWHKVFVMGPITHARRFFLEGYAGSWIPEPVLRALGVGIPFLELAAGLLLVVGFRTRGVLLAVGTLLLVVTYGHLLANPFFDTTVHVFPRLVIVAALLATPRRADRWSLDGWLRGRNG